MTSTANTEHIKGLRGRCRCPKCVARIMKRIDNKATALAINDSRREMVKESVRYRLRGEARLVARRLREWLCWKGED